MTVIVAAKFKRTVVMAADSLTTLEDVNLAHAVNDPKLIHFGQFVIGMAGTGPMAEILNEMREDISEGWGSKSPKKRLDLLPFLEYFTNRLEEKGECSDANQCQLLVGTKSKIFLTVAQHNVYEQDPFWSIGSGSPYALGALSVLYPEVVAGRMKLDDAVYRAAKAACDYDNGCKEPINLIRM